ncbi:DUF637 domain-containing protein, partial [Pseudomonas palleroniana]|uniref:DUF637 domain-containing protein n=1 Tax=Pseudomonas palleroniana TaxID=191390 RepID=UPI0018E68E79
GGDVSLSAGKDLAMIASRVSAGDEAYLVAGGKLGLLAAEDSDYSLYDMKKKGSFGSKKTQRDEVTQVTNIGSEITTGGDLTLKSGSDQVYQAAKLESGQDITLDSGGGITFEAAKDLHQESHEKSNNNAFWVSAKGKGNTDETVRQTQMVAEGNIAIKAVEGLKIDVLQVNQQTVSQSIDAMVKADPQLAWLKDAEKRGDVDWRQVKEIHDSFKYSNSGLGPASQIIIAIVMATVLGPMAATAAGGTVTGAAVGAVASGAATNATVSVINNRGNLGAVLKDVTSSDAMKGYVISGVTAGLTVGVFDGWTGTQTNPSTGAVITSPALNTWTGAGQFAANQVLQNGTSTLLSKALGQGGDFGDALKGALFNTLAAASFNAVGDYTQGKLTDGYPPKILVHAMVGGLLSQATGGDFKTGALAAGINEAAVVHLDSLVRGDKNLLSMSSQIVGVLAAASQKDADAKSIEKGGWVAKNATQYNYQGHIEDYEKKHESCSANPGGTGCTTILNMAGKSSRNLGDVVINQGADGSILSYTLIDKTTGKPFMIMEPAEYKAYVTASPAIQEGYKSASPWSLDMASTLSYGYERNGSKALESYASMLSNPGYWGEMGLGLALSLAPTTGMLRWGASGETTTVSVFRKMSAAEADATLDAMQLQPHIPGKNSSKYLSESAQKVEAFQNNGSMGVPQKTLEFVLDKPGYDAMMKKSVDQVGSKGIDAVKVNYEGIDPISNLRNIGVPPSQLELFNSLIKKVRPVGE